MHDRALIPVGTKKEIPGALAGATEDKAKAFWAWFENNLNRQHAASDLVAALMNCDPEDRFLFLETLLAQLRPGFPRVLLIDAMRECRAYVADLPASYRKAMCLACYEAMPEADQRSFVAYVTEVRHG